MKKSLPVLLLVLCPALVIAAGHSRVAGAGNGGGAGAVVRININTASAELLDESLPGIGPRKAEAIVAWRRQHGRFRHVDQLMEIKGIGQAFMTRNRGRISVQ